ncbi:hypothetical protein [Sphingobium yanoikuyae]|uniref:hypothetical protein n=1 Tax=Sphingobium yanoikuyae TaxID=13690 RepID=UPI0028A7A107|nr:hypothetical protein [Sphingobium yanoikuyae]
MIQVDRGQTRMGAAVDRIEVQDMTIGRTGFLRLSPILVDGREIEPGWHKMAIAFQSACQGIHGGVLPVQMFRQDRGLIEIDVFWLRNAERQSLIIMFQRGFKLSVTAEQIGKIVPVVGHRRGPSSNQVPKGLDSGTDLAGHHQLHGIALQRSGRGGAILKPDGHVNLVAECSSIYWDMETGHIIRRFV